jgi:hypothetical protein
MTVEIETKLAVLERDITAMSGIFPQLNATMTKLTDISSSIKEMLAVHDSKINKHEQTDDQLYGLIEKRRIQSDSQHQDIQLKIIQSEKDIKRDMDDFQKTMMAEMKDIRRELKEYHDCASKSSSLLDKGKLILYAIGILLSFILYKIGVIPFVKF